MAPAPRRAASLLLLALFAPACLSTSYRVSADELARLARTDPEERWQVVRATQRMLDSDRPPGTAVTAPVTAPVVVVPNTYFFRGRSWNVPATWHHGATATAASSGGGSSSSGGHSHSGGGSGGGGNAGAAAVAVAVAVVAGAAFVLAATEGSRYDGWLGVAPDELVYLDQPDGSVLAVPLSALSPQLTDNAYGATLYEGPEERYLRLGRAPLDRVGLTLQTGLVMAMVPQGDEGFTFGLGGRAFAGGYLAPPVGLGATADIVGGVDGSVVALVGAEAQVMPLLWAGAYAGVGWSSFAAAHAQAVGGWYARGGLHFELPVTTRFAPSLRAGVTRLDLDAGALWMPELSLGLSVY